MSAGGRQRGRRLGQFGKREPLQTGLEVAGRMGRISLTAGCAALGGRQERRLHHPTRRRSRLAVEESPAPGRGSRDGSEWSTDQISLGEGWRTAGDRRPVCRTAARPASWGKVRLVGMALGARATQAAQGVCGKPSGHGACGRHLSVAGQAAGAAGDGSACWAGVRGQG